MSDAAAPTVVKLGGSVLTRKREVERLRPKILTRLAEEVAEAPGPVVLLHGAGSFGHPGAVRFGLARAPGPDRVARQRARGAAVVSAEVRRLHLAVLRALVAAGGRPWSVPAAVVAANSEGRLLRLDAGPFREALESGFMPVSFGDVVPDAVWGRSILSADTLAVELVRNLGAPRVLFVSDVPGIMDRRGAGRPRLISEVDVATVEALRALGGGPDVTGGIRGKAEAMRAIGRLGAEAGLISGLSDGLLSRALRGERVPGSWVRAEGRQEA